jgi:hypothetical protein
MVVRFPQASWPKTRLACTAALDNRGRGEGEQCNRECRLVLSPRKDTAGMCIFGRRGYARFLSLYMMCRNQPHD